jgi:two-component system, OmpR family, response regulator QseB
MRLLLLEDNVGLAEPLVALFEREGYTITWAMSKEAALEAFFEAEPDLAILDVMLPEGDDAGFELAQELREAGYQGHILFLSARAEIDDRVRGLDIGGDDYLTKPFSIVELSARVRAILRRQAPTKRARFQQGDLLVDYARQEVYWQNESVPLSEKEFALLSVFTHYPDRHFTVEALFDKFFANTDSGTRIVRVYIHRLRQKIAPNVIETTQGGYRLGM